MTLKGQKLKERWFWLTLKTVTFIVVFDVNENVVGLFKVYYGSLDICEGYKTFFGKTHGKVIRLKIFILFTKDI